MKIERYLYFFMATSVASAQFDADLSSDLQLAERVNRDLLLFKQLENYQKNQGSNFLTVGGGGSCDTNAIQNALDANVEEIRVASDQVYFENIVIDNQSVMLRGGFADCDDANINNQTTLYSQINGGGIDTVIKVQGNSQQNTVVLENLDIRNGFSVTGNGGVRVSQNPSYSGSVYIVDSIVQFNSTNGRGAGIGFVSFTDDIDLVISNTQVVNNTSASGVGGGLNCFGSRASVVLAGDTQINFNSAEIGVSFPNGNGGGMALESGCDVSIHAGVNIENNKAERAGGGIHISGDANVVILGREYCNDGVCVGVDGQAVEVSNNRAGFPALDNDGGGIFLAGTTGAQTSLLQAYGSLHLRDNQARLGAGIYVDGANILLSGSVQDYCVNSMRCILFSGNKTSSDNGTGGAIYSKDSVININHAFFEDNRADTATAIYTTGQDTVTRIENSVFTHNGNDGVGGFNDLYVLRAFSGARFDIAYSTFADNHANTIFGINNSSNTLNLSSSIVHDPSSGDVLVNNNANIQINCVMAHEVSSISGNLLSLNNPDFVDRSNRDFHLSASSPAIDYCNELGMTIFALRDIDFESRGFDDPNVVNNFINSFYDIGVDEFRDLIFANGFEPVFN